MRFVPGSGPLPSSVMFIAERPGREEDRTGIPLTGPSGRLFNSFLWQFLHLNRSQVFVTNLVHHFHESHQDVPPTAKEIADDWPALLQEVEDCNPDFIITLGRFATRAFMGDVDMEVVHGIPSLVGPHCICPSYHPAAGLHNTELSALVAYDFMQAAAVIRGDLEPTGLVEDDHAEPRYEEKVGNLGNGEQLVAIDTEGTPSRPWGLSETSHEGRADVLRAGRGQYHFAGQAVMHNSMYDLGMLRALGVPVGDDRFDDTMIMAYLLCVEPQGLKPLARRHAGMLMDSYDDIIGDAGLRLAEDYFVRITEWLSNPLNRELLGLSAITPKRKRVRTSANAGRRSGKTYQTSAESSRTLSA